MGENTENTQKPEKSLKRKLTLFDGIIYGVGVPIAGGIGVAMLGALWAYDGWLNTCTLGEELIKPPKNLPKAIIAGLSICMLVFVVNIAIYNTPPMAQVVAVSLFYPGRRTAALRPKGGVLA